MATTMGGAALIAATLAFSGAAAAQTAEPASGLAAPGAMDVNGTGGTGRERGMGNATRAAEGRTEAPAGVGAARGAVGVGAGAASGTVGGGVDSGSPH